ncbi:MAG: hypothetical protein J6B98_03745 [Bacilli bacterium]|nr:hypothetical protein [Bacilli bacterium]
MKKYLGILLIMIGMILIPGNVKAGLEMILNTDEFPCTTETNLDKKITTCQIVYRNTGDTVFEGGNLELAFTPTDANTTVSFLPEVTYATLQSVSGNVYSMNVNAIEAGQIAIIGIVTWTADASLNDSEVGGTISPTWKPIADVDNGTITEDYGEASSDLFIQSYTQEKTYNVTITWGCLEYDYVEKLDGTSEWKAAAFSDGMGENYVLVENYSNVAMNAYIKFESSIEGVEANYITDYSYYENDEEHVSSSNLDYLTLDAYVENENNYHASVQWIVNLTGGTYAAVEDAYNNGERKIGTVTILVGDATMGDVG